MRWFLVQMHDFEVSGSGYYPEDVAIAIVSGGPFAVASVDEIGQGTAMLEAVRAGIRGENNGGEAGG